MWQLNTKMKRVLFRATRRISYMALATYLSVRSTLDEQRGQYHTISLYFTTVWISLTLKKKNQSCLDLYSRTRQRADRHARVSLTYKGWHTLSTNTINKHTLYMLLKQDIPQVLTPLKRLLFCSAILYQTSIRHLLITHISSNFRKIFSGMWGWVDQGMV